MTYLTIIQLSFTLVASTWLYCLQHGTKKSSGQWFNFCGLKLQGFSSAPRIISIVQWQHSAAVNRKKSITFNPQVNYTDWSTATCWRNLVPTSVDRGVSHSQRGGAPMTINLSFLSCTNMPTSSNIAEQESLMNNECAHQLPKQTMSKSTH
jgi:hypothetical protein